MLPTLSRLSVSPSIEARLRYRCSSRSLQISPLHLEFQFLPMNSSLPVSGPAHQLSQCISNQTSQAAYTPFTPNNSEQRSHPTYYRGCWHVVSRCLFLHYSHQMGFPLPPLFLTEKRTLQPYGLHRPRGVAPSGFSPLRKILSCCLPSENGPCPSPSGAAPPLRPAIHRSLGGPFPRKLAKGPQTHPQALQLDRLHRKYLRRKP